MARNNVKPNPTPKLDYLTKRELTEEEQVMWRDFNIADAEACDIGDSKSAVGLTIAASRLYHVLVRNGLAPQLRRKYRYHP